MVRPIPVKVSQRIGAVKSTKSASDTARINLSYQPLGISISRSNRTCLYAWCFPTIITGSGNKSCLLARQLGFPFKYEHIHPADRAVFVFLFISDNRNIVLRHACCNTCLACNTFFKVYNHCPTWRVFSVTLCFAHALDILTFVS